MNKPDSNKSSQVFFIKKGSYPQFENFQGVKQRILAVARETMLVEAIIEAGCRVTEHSHPNEQITYVIEGDIEVTVGEQTSKLQGGDCFTVPPKMVHAVKAFTRAVVIDSFYPLRADLVTGA